MSSFSKKKQKLLFKPNQKFVCLVFWTSKILKCLPKWTQAENTLDRVPSRGFAHPKCFSVFPDGPPKLVQVSFATLEGCVDIRLKFANLTDFRETFEETVISIHIFH